MGIHRGPNTASGINGYNLILHLDPANTCCVKPNATTCINLVTRGLVTGANGNPGVGVHTPLPANFPKISSLQIFLK